MKMDMKKVAAVVLAILIAISSIGLGIVLLCYGFFDGTQFTAFSIAFTVVALIIAFSSEVQEFSIAGNIVKLKQVKREAEIAIEELKLSRITTYKMLLKISKKYSGGVGEVDAEDERLDDFWFLYDQIEKFKIEKDLSVEIEDATNELLLGALRDILNYCDNLYSKYVDPEEYPEPHVLLTEALEPSCIDATCKRTRKSKDELKKVLNERIDTYERLFQLNKRVKKWHNNRFQGTP